LAIGKTTITRGECTIAVFRRHQIILLGDGDSSMQETRLTFSRKSNTLYLAISCIPWTLTSKSQCPITARVLCSVRKNFTKFELFAISRAQPSRFMLPPWPSTFYIHLYSQQYGWKKQRE